MPSLEVVGPGDGLSTAPSLAAMATAAYSCDRTAAAPLPRLGNGWQCGGGMAPAFIGDGLKIYSIVGLLFVYSFIP